MKFYQRLDSQLAALFVVIFASMVTLTGLLDTVDTQIWIRPANTELPAHLAQIEPQFKPLGKSENRTELVKSAQAFFQQLGQKQQEFVYMLANQQFEIVAHTGGDITFIELVRAEPQPAKNLYSVVTSSVFGKNEYFVTFVQVPALQTTTEFGETLLLLAISNPVSLEVPDEQGRLWRNLFTHLDVFGWYYLLAIIIIITLMRYRLAPLRKLEQAANQLTHNQLPQTLDIKTTNDEVGQLVSAFNTAVMRLNQNEQMRNRLIGDIAHELRTPLTNLSGRIEAFEDGLITDPKALIDFTNRQVKGLTRIVEDMNLLTSMDEQVLVLNKTNTEISALLKDQLKAANIGEQFTWQVDGDEVQLPLDIMRFGQIINNLLDNAQKAQPQQLIVNIKVSVVNQSSQNHVQINFEDNGPGVEAQHLPHLFDRLYRVDDSRNNATGGSGLGLSIVKNLVKAHEGYIECYSAQHGGLGFVITLPVS